MSEYAPGPTQNVNADHVGTAINAKYFMLGRNPASENVIREQDLEWLKAIYVRTGGYEEASALLEERDVVALVANPGAGRRITAQVLLAERGCTPSEIAVDLDDPDHLIADADHGYVIQVETLGSSPVARQRTALSDYLRIVRAEGALAIVCVTREIAVALELAQLARVVYLRPAESRAIFAQHLGHLRSSALAEKWGLDPSIRGSLDGTSPADAARLAELADRSITARPEASFDDQVSEALGAFKNWTTALDQWFGRPVEKPGQPYARVMLLAAAVLDGRSAASVFTAARALEERLDIPHQSGHGLGDNPATAQAEDITARLDAGRISFTRPAYAEAVLDYIWERWPQLQPDLRDWMIELVAGNELSDDDRAAAAGRLTELAVRHRAPELLFKACEKWQAHVPFRLAVEGLTIAGMSAEIGRVTRRRLYDWSTQAGSSYRSIVIEVCAGPLADAFPGVALTRLRHVANNGNDEERQRVINAVCGLSSHAPIRSEVWKTLTEWTRDDRGRPQVAVAEQAIAFILSASDEDGNLRVLDGRPRHDWLTSMWRIALSSSASRKATAAAMMSWLDAALADPVTADIVVDVLVATCENHLDLGNLTAQIHNWSRWSSAADEESRQRLFQTLIGRIADRVPGASTTAVDRAYGTMSVPEP